MIRLISLLAGGVFAISALAQSYPNKPIKLIVGYPPGGSGDFLTRLAADELTKELGAPVIVDNRPGAGGNIAHDLVAHSPPDGYTVLNATHMAINRALYKSLTYDPDKDFAAVTRIATGPTVICVNNSLPVKDLRELIAYAKQNPGKLFHASAGYGSAPHLASVLFESVAGIKFTHVQFKGGGPATQSLLAGDTQVNFATAPTVMGFVRAGRVRALAVSSRHPTPAAPGIAGAEEAGLPGYDFTFWFGLFVPAGTPHAAIERLHAAMAKALGKPEMREK
ncbi:MAG: tripartite tricarboxylate transporter substrate binding protein, partial [Betaproteobacteria bacterium]|nr:tripartite tricarboxylate transporter substrate binding protein [Betaproteobacteria bacterium]